MAVLVRDTDMPTEEPRAADDGGQLYSQTNIFEAGDSTRALSTPSLGKGRTRGYARSLHDLLIDDAVTSSYHPATVFDVSAHSAVGVEPADLGLRDRIVAGAGWQDTLRGEGWVRMPGWSGAPSPAAPW